MSDLDDAIVVAVLAHHEQYDKAGEPYIFHLINVAQQLHPLDTDGRIVAILHDILEDTATTVDDLRFTCTETQIEAIIAITRKEGEDYDDYIERVKLNPIATRVKICDLRHNLGRLWRLNESTRNRLRPRYERAMAALGGQL
jgi:(p)ppGpp synthase/HD superfamily hydrolase